MKYLLVILIFCSISGNAQESDSVRYNTYAPELGWLVGYDSSVNSWYVSRIYKVETFQTLKVPCRQVFYWSGEDKDSIGFYTYSSGKCVDSLACPCGCNGFSIFEISHYKGDSIVDTNCESSEYSLYKTEYYKPAKSKKWKLGEKYDMKPNEHFADYKKWYPKPFFIMCS